MIDAALLCWVALAAPAAAPDWASLAQSHLESTLGPGAWVAGRARKTDGKVQVPFDSLFQDLSPLHWKNEGVVVLDEATGEVVETRVNRPLSPGDLTDTLGEDRAKEAAVRYVIQQRLAWSGLNDEPEVFSCKKYVLSRAFFDQSWGEKVFVELEELREQMDLIEDQIEATPTREDLEQLRNQIGVLDLIYEQIAEYGAVTMPADLVYEVELRRGLRRVKVVVHGPTGEVIVSPTDLSMKKLHGFPSHTPEDLLKMITPWC